MKNEGKVKQYLDAMSMLKKLESELNFAYVVPQDRHDAEGMAVQQLQMTFLWNLGFALVDPHAIMIDRTAIKYAAPEKMSQEEFERAQRMVVKIETDFLKGEFESMDNYLGIMQANRHISS